MKSTGLLFACLLMIVCSTAVLAKPPDNRLPAQAAEALAKAKSAVIFSIEPMMAPVAGDKTLHRYLVFGSATLNAADTAFAGAEFRKSIDNPGPQALCFVPRHALRISAGGVTYD